MNLANRLAPSCHPLPRAAEPMPAVPADAVDARRGSVDAVLASRHAGTRRLRLDYELVGPAGAPVVFVAGGISAHRHVAANALDAAPGWAEGLLGAGRALDPSRLRILAFDYVGADGSLDAPIDTADQADAVALLLDALGIDALAGFVGYSYGAMVGPAVRGAACVAAAQAGGDQRRASPASVCGGVARAAAQGGGAGPAAVRRRSRGCRWRASSRC